MGGREARVSGRLALSGMQQHARRSGKAGAWPGERRARAPGGQSLKCPRCSSTNTKFCYYNNYNLSQPRHFCKSCRRYWTNGGVLRNVPVGGGSRKPPKPSKSKLPCHDNPHPPLPLNFTTTLPSASASDYSVGLCPTPEEDKNVSETAGLPALQVVQGQVANGGELVGSEWPGGGEAEFFELGAALEQSYCWETLGQWPELDQGWHSP